VLTPSYVRLGYFVLAVLHGITGIGLILPVNNVWRIAFAIVGASLLYQQVFRYVGLAISNKEEP